nr:WD repeat-containing protein 43 isoform X4 [Malus domestica]
MKSKKGSKARAKYMVKDNGMVETEDLPIKSKKGSKKRAAAPDSNPPTVKDILEIDGVLVDDDLNEPTMGEKLGSLNLLDNDRPESHDKEESSLDPKPPTADSVHILLKQALHADDRALLLDCLYTQDEKVIAKSISQLNPSGLLKLLQSLISIIQSRGAILACALPWLRSLLLQHASGIVSQESSLSALNSLYQLIESRVSTFQSALQLSSVLDVHYPGVIDDVDENETITPFIYESDTSDGEGSEEAMETDQENEEEEESDGALDGVSDFDGIEDMSE